MYPFRFHGHNKNFTTRCVVESTIIVLFLAGTVKKSVLWGMLFVPMRRNQPNVACASLKVIYIGVSRIWSNVTYLSALFTYSYYAYGIRKHLEAKIIQLYMVSGTFQSSRMATTGWSTLITTRTVWCTPVKKCLAWPAPSLPGSWAVNAPWMRPQYSASSPWERRWGFVCSTWRKRSRPTAELSDPWHQYIKFSFLS